MEGHWSDLPDGWWKVPKSCRWSSRIIPPHGEEKYYIPINWGKNSHGIYLSSQEYNHSHSILGKLPKKSMEILSHGLEGVGNGVYTILTRFIGFLMLWSVHPWTYLATSWSMLGQSTYLFKNANVFSQPKWPTILEVWASLINWIWLPSFEMQIFPNLYNNPTWM